MDNKRNGLQSKLQYITDDELKVILTKYGYDLSEINIKHYAIRMACENKMLGFLADHLILNVDIITNEKQKMLNFFIKAIPKNEAKALFVSSLNLFEKELKFYEIMKKKMDLSGLKPWCGNFVANLGHAVVFEDLTSQQYQMHDKNIKFDMQHISEALKTLARFHANSIIYEENMAKNLKAPYRLYEEHGEYSDEGHFSVDNPWFSQCRIGALAAVKQFSKYKDDKKLIEIIEERWNEVWNSALNLSGSEERNVLCHRDLWNNNLLFHYKENKDGCLVPDNCVLVDFQALRYQPPAGDVMFLLHCCLKPQFRKDNTKDLLNFYYDELKDILYNNGINIQDVIPRDSFAISANKHNLWGAVVNAALIQVFALDDKLTMEMFSEAAKFQEIIWNDRTTYIKAMVQKSDSYKHKIMEPIEQFVEECILTSLATCT